MSPGVLALTGAAIGGVVGWFGATALFGAFLGNGQAALAGLIYGGPIGAMIGAIVGWLIARRRVRP